MRRPSSVALLLCIATSGLAQTTSNSAETRAIRTFNAAKVSGPLPLHAFLANMPKGADLHMHLSGAV